MNPDKREGPRMGGGAFSQTEDSGPTNVPVITDNPPKVSDAIKFVENRSDLFTAGEAAALFALLRRATNENCRIPDGTDPSLTNRWGKPLDRRPSIDDLVKATKCAKSTVARVLNDLEKRRALVRFRTKGGVGAKTGYHVFPYGTDAVTPRASKKPPEPSPSDCSSDRLSDCSSDRSNRTVNCPIELYDVPAQRGVPSRTQQGEVVPPASSSMTVRERFAVGPCAVPGCGAVSRRSCRTCFEHMSREIEFGEGMP